MRRDLVIHETAHAVDFVRRRDGGVLLAGGRRHDCRMVHEGADRLTLLLDGREHEVIAVADGARLYVHAFGRAWDVEVVDPAERAARAAGGGDEVATAPMPGAVFQVLVQAGDEVRKGQPLLIIESMKMQTEITARRDGMVERVQVVVGQTFERGAQLVMLVKE